MISTCASTATRRRRRVTRVLRQSRALCEKPRFLLPPVPSFLCYHCPHKSVQESGRREGGRHGGAISRVGTAETEPVEAVSSGGGRQRPRLLYHGAPAPAVRVQRLHAADGPAGAGDTVRGPSRPRHYRAGASGNERFRPAGADQKEPPNRGPARPCPDVGEQLPDRTALRAGWVHGLSEKTRPCRRALPGRPVR